MGSPAFLGFQPRSLGLKLGARRPTRRLIYGLLFVLAVLSYLCYAHPQAFKDHIGWRIKEAHLYALQYTRYNFKPTVFEQQCFDGTAARINSHNLTDTIPETIHFIWIGNSEISFKLYLAIRAALVSTGVTSAHLHHDTPLNGDNGWLRLLKPNLTLIHFDRPDYLTEVAAYHPETWSVTHQTDAMRLHVLHAQGGIYLDSDAYILRPLNHLFEGARDVYMGLEGGNRWGLCNGVIMAKAGAPFLARWLDEYASFDDSRWSDHSVYLPKTLATKHPDEICTLSPSAFFWPMWTKGSLDWMHESLNKEEAAAVESQIAKNGGSLFEDQLIYHAWAHPGAKHLGRLTPDIIRDKDTRFNLLMRRFLE
ncbi:hypothetical protein INS49_007855 [Diaporthe citri]|uniref:uncharacterized protein n=1 Tax=Diaporthe citri TaxID=83186 RepID=UPI001C7FA23F|nr:uncharacterized protein INS49_007855 [Diaporthe citri]KAG6362761.1 hypothetical protein INS49_007855 [Diaporthe citri]